MKVNLQNIIEYADRYMNNDLGQDEWQMISRQLQVNDVLQAAWDEQIAFLKALKGAGERSRMKDLIASVGTEAGKDIPEITPKTLNFRKYLKTGGIAAAIALLSSVTTYYLATNRSQHNATSQYVTLSKKLDALKDSQSRIINNINADRKSEQEQRPAMPGNFSGSGFALTNDGYIATDYHVVEGADSIYIQTAEGTYHKVYIVAFEPSKDLAILKVEDNGFRFGKGQLPYTISRKQSDLAQPVFSLGFPQDEVVYNEGYISSRKGYKGDVSSYQLDITANPGQSGSPVFDQNGNVIALVTAKETDATYAIHSQALLDLVKSLPKAANLRLPENNRMNSLKRTEQVKKAMDYVCAVKVYK